MSGTHILAVEGLSYPWVVKSVTYRGQDITDTGLDVSGRQQRFDEVRVTITDVASEVSGDRARRGGRRGPGCDRAHRALVGNVLDADQPPARRAPHGRGRTIPDPRTAGRREYRAVASLEMDESEAYRPGLLRNFREIGAALSLKSSRAAGARSRADIGGADDRSQKASSTRQRRACPLVLSPDS